MQSVNVMLEPIRAILLQIGAFLPRLALAIVVLVIGFLIAKAVRFALQKALRAINFHILTQRSGVDDFFQQGGMVNDTSGLIGLFVYWVVVLAALIIAFNGLGLSYVTDLLTRVMLFVPRVFFALVVLVLGGYFARFIGNTLQGYCRRNHIGDAAVLGKLAQYVITVFVVIIALDLIDIGGDIVRQTFLILLAGIVLALALAFGLGGKDWAAARLERWWPSWKREDED